MKSAFKPITVMDYHSFKAQLKDLIGEFTINIKPSFPPTNSTVVGISQSGEWI